MISSKAVSSQGVILILAMIVSGCSYRGEVVSDGSNTNWLSECEDSADCETDSSCICGLCSRTCERDQQCRRGKRPASCVDPVLAESTSGCAAIVREAETRICLPDCKDNGDCSGRSACIEGACWPEPEGVEDLRRDAADGDLPPSGAGAITAAASRDASIASLFPDDLDGLDAAMDFSEPIELPEPEQLISGVSSASSIVGVWEEAFEERIYFEGPVRLVIRETDDSSGLVGSMSVMCGLRFPIAVPCPDGPPPTATDPNADDPPSEGIQPNLPLFASSPDPQEDLISLFDYRIFDASIDFTTNRYDSLREQLDTVDAAAQPLAPKANITADPGAVVPVGQWLGETGTGQEKGCINSERVALQIVSLDEEPGAFGIVTFGEGEPPPPAVDPDVIYPPDYDFDLELDCAFSIPMNGYSYAVREGRTIGNNRFIFRISLFELYQTWCSLQTSYPHSDLYNSFPPTYTCVPQISYNEIIACSDMVSLSYDDSFDSAPTTDFECPIDPGKFLLCNFYTASEGPCLCDEQGCVAMMNRSIQFDLTVDGTEMAGVITTLYPGHAVAPVEVRLRKVD